MKRVFAVVFASVMCVLYLVGGMAVAGEFKPDRDITVVSREDGSGTRGAFVELMGVEVKGEDGTKKDMTSKEAVIVNKTDVMLANIAGDPHAIGYVSLGSLNDSVKALAIDGVAAAAENVKNGSYPIARPFIIATDKAKNISPVAKDFMAFILSKEGQNVVSKGYIPVDENAAAYSGKMPQGKITVAGSSSVTPVMEKLKEAYIARNPNAEIEIQMSDSSAGMTAVMEGICDIGMASRNLKESELAKLAPTSIALDGIAVIVHKSNPAENATREQIRDVFIGKTVTWQNIL